MRPVMLHLMVTAAKTPLNSDGILGSSDSIQGMNYSSVSCVGPHGLGVAVVLMNINNTRGLGDEDVHHYIRPE